MSIKNHKIAPRIIIVIITTVLLGVTYYLIMVKPSPRTHEMTQQAPAKTSQTPSVAPMPDELYIGQDVAIGDSLKVKVPNGWRASVSRQSSFLAIQFARPGTIESLLYDQSVQPSIDYDGIPAWSGLTEHFYIRQITSRSQAFNPAQHQEVTTKSFMFDDGTIGKKYSVTKHVSEAAKWGGLLKDSEWYGRVFVYEKDGKIAEAHLAFYPSTKIDSNFYEKVAKSIHF